MLENILLLIFIMLPFFIGLLLYLFFVTFRLHLKKRQWAWLLTGNMLIFIFLSSFIIPCGEVYYRFFYDTTDAFGLTKITKNWFMRHFHLNKSGIRDSVEIYHFEKTTEKRRITFIGDSFTAGHGINNVEDRFANRIRNQRPDWEVQVLAWNGIDTGVEIQRIKKLLKFNYEFDQMVLVYNLNDISDIVPEWQEILTRIYKSSNPGFLALHSYFFNTLYYRNFAAHDPDIADYYRFVIDAYNGPIWEEQKMRLSKIKEWMDEKDNNFLVVTFPFLHAIGPDYKYNKVHERLASLWRNLNVPHLDLLPLYISHDSENLIVSSHDPHPNERAHEMAANEIIDFLEKHKTKIKPPTKKDTFRVIRYQIKQDP